MTAIKKEELERLETEHGLEPDGLTYQHRCSRITAVMKGETWTPPIKPEPRQQIEAPASDNRPTISRIKSHPLYGKRILITPMITPEKNRFQTYDEPLGPVIETEDYQAGKAIYNADKDTQRMYGDYNIVRVDPTQQVIAKASIPKVNTEISWCIGKELVPVVRGNDGQRGYIWSIPTQCIQVEDTVIQLYGLKTLIENQFPELLSKFSGKPTMMYVDGVTLAASIPQTEAILKEHTRQQKIDERAGIL